MFGPSTGKEASEGKFQDKKAWELHVCKGGAQATIKFGTEFAFCAESHPTLVQYIHTIIWVISYRHLVTVLITKQRVFFPPINFRYCCPCPRNLYFT